VACLALLAGCSHQSASTDHAAAGRPSTSGVSSQVSGSAFCSFLVALDTQAMNATSPAAGLQVLKSAEAQLRAEAASAPAVLRPDLQTVIRAADASIQHQDLSYLAADDVAAAGARLSSQCQVKNH
jgi:hypothetical protein